MVTNNLLNLIRTAFANYRIVLAIQVFFTILYIITHAIRKYRIIRFGRFMCRFVVLGCFLREYSFFWMALFAHVGEKITKSQLRSIQAFVMQSMIIFVGFILLSSAEEEKEKNKTRSKEPFMNLKKLNACACGEFSVDIDGTNYLVIYGTHINGGWCAIPSHSISCEIGNPMDIFYNTERLSAVGIDQAAAIIIAGAIKDDSEKRWAHQQEKIGLEQ